MNETYRKDLIACMTEVGGIWPCAPMEIWKPRKRWEALVKFATNALIAKAERRKEET